MVILQDRSGHFSNQEFKQSLKYSIKVYQIFRRPGPWSLYCQYLLLKFQRQAAEVSSTCWAYGIPLVPDGGGEPLKWKSCSKIQTLRL